MGKVDQVAAAHSYEARLSYRLGLGIGYAALRLALLWAAVGGTCHLQVRPVG